MSNNENDMVQIRAWAECKADLEMELGLPAERRAVRIEELIAQRTAGESKQPTTLTDEFREQMVRCGHSLAATVKGVLKAAELPDDLYAEAMAIALDAAKPDAT